MPGVRVGVAVAALLGAGLVAGCSDQTGSDAQRAFEEQAREQLGDGVRFENTVTDDMPGVGSFWAYLLLPDDATDAQVDDALAVVRDFEPPGLQLAYHPRGVEANGVGICTADTDQAPERALRSWLAAGQTSLQGRWSCEQEGDDAIYSGSWADYQADAALVLSAGIPGIEPQDGRPDTVVTDPRGVIAGTWRVVPAQVDAVLTTVAATTPVKGFRLDDSGLYVTVEPVGDDTALVADADRAAAGALPVTIWQGQPNDAASDRYAAMKQLTDAMLTVPGVTDAYSTDSERVFVTVAAPADVIPVDRALRSDAHFRPDDIVLLALGDEGRIRDPSRRHLALGVTPQHLDTFAALAALPGVTVLRMQESAPPGGQPAAEVIIRIDSLPPEQIPALVRPLLPEGMAVSLIGTGGAAYDFVVTEPIGALTRSAWGEGPPAETVRAAWQAAG